MGLLIMTGLSSDFSPACRFRLPRSTAKCNTCKSWEMYKPFRQSEEDALLEYEALILQGDKDIQRYETMWVACEPKE